MIELLTLRTFPKHLKWTYVGDGHCPCSALANHEEGDGAPAAEQAHSFQAQRNDSHRDGGKRLSLKLKGASETKELGLGMSRVAF